MKTNVRLIIANSIFLLFFVITDLGAQQIISKSILLSDQLSPNETSDIFQDNSGFIWIGTSDGITRYDGYSIRAFRNSFKTSTQLTNNTITFFAEDETHIWAGTTKGINLINKETLQITPFNHPAIQNRNIRTMSNDSKGAVWIGTDAEIYRYANGELEHINSSNRKFYPNSIYEDRNGDIWILTWRGGMFKYTEETHSFTAYPAIGHTNNPFRMIQDRDNQYWIVTWGDGLWRFDPNASPEEMYIPQTVVNPIRNAPETIFYDIVQDDMYGYLWALSYSGVCTLRIRENKQVEQINIPDFEHQQNAINVTELFTRVIKDRDGNLWLNSYNKGNVILFNKEKIENIAIKNMYNEIGIYPDIKCFQKGNDNIIWFNQERYGLCLFNEANGNLAYSAHMGVGMTVSQILPSRTDRSIWVGDMFVSKVWNLKQENMRISILEEINFEHVVRSPGYITHMKIDASNNIWVGTNKRLFVRDHQDKSISVVEGVQGVTGIAEDPQGNILVGTYKGILEMSFDSRPYIKKLYNPTFMSAEDEIVALCTDMEGNAWFATSLGRFFKIDKETSIVSDHSEACGLDGERILQILSHNNSVWIIQNKRIIRHTPKGENYFYSVTDDNIFLSSFRYGAAFIDNGKLYVAGPEGYVMIDPAGEHAEPKDYEVSISDIRMNGTSMLSDTYSQEYAVSINELKLPSDARNIEVDFSTLTYESTDRIEYAYYLAGEDAHWTYLANGKHTASFSRLNKGKHTLLVKAKRTDGKWSDKVTRLTITRLPAPYETWYAKLLYAVVILLIVYVALRAYLKRIDEKIHIEFQEKLTQAKLNYFTNISHELLTPLTVISCATDDLDENVQNSERQVGILRSNIDRLKRLLVQVLDFSKVESNNMPLRVTYSNISAFIGGIAASNFEYLAQQKNIKFTTQIEKDIWGYMDSEKIDKILFNILSNAIKYTPENKGVSLSTSTVTRNGIHTLIIKVADEGIGIDAKDVQNIFIKFYNNKDRVGYESNGIGLSLTKELVTLHHGTIEVESEPGKGSTFTIELPLDKSVYGKQEIVETEIPEATPIQPESLPDDAGNKFCILYVDDNPDLRELMKTILQHNYQVITAKDGEEGLQLVTSHPVDIIICDLMMPRMDGLEFSRHIKDNIQTCHIPVLILTAKNTPEDQMESYKAGVEGFITKPFDKDVLEARIINLLNAQKIRQRSFQTFMDVNISNLDYETIDEQFLSKAIACIEEHLDEPDFDIPQLADELHVSRSTLRRKFKVIAGLAPWDFIRNVKLKHACNLLQKKTITISEVAYATGFSNPKYFAKCFKDEFGMTPKEYQGKL